MPTADDIAQQQALLAAHRRTLAALLQQLALLSAAHAPPGVLNGIVEARTSIAHSKAALRAWGVAVEEHPDDLAPDMPKHLGSPTLHHLRPPVSDFVGHEQTVDHLVTALHTMADADRAALAAIRGMGGAGKTELALTLAQRLVPHFPDAQVLVELRGAGERPLTPEQALQAVIRIFQPQERLVEDRATLEVQYRALLVGKRVLILADDAKDVVQVRPLLPPAGCVLLLTSRSRFALPGLQSDLILDLEGLPVEEAATLLRGICPRIQDRAFELAQRCAFLPLALRVSASLLASDATRRLDRYLQQLADERERLVALRDPDDPSLDVAASLALSYDALDPAAQATLQQCAVFPGSFDAAAAQATIRLSADSGMAIEDVLGALYRRSLVGYDSATERYQLHDLVRAFAATRLTDTERADMRRRHAEYYLALAQPSGAWQAWFERLTVEYPNIRAALDWLFKQDDNDSCVQIVSDLFRFWRTRGQITEGRSWVERALQRGAQASASVRARLLSMAGRLALDQEDLATARRYYTESLELRHGVGERRSIAVQIGHLSWISFLEGHLSEARRLIEQALDTYQGLGLQSDVAGALVQLASIALAQRSYAEAQRFCEGAVALSQAINDRYGITSATLRLGQIAVAQGDDALARRYFEECLAFMRTSGQSANVAFTLRLLGSVVFRQGDVKQAYMLLEESAAIYMELGNLTRAAHALDWLSRIAFVEGHDHAGQYTTRCLELYRAIQDSQGIAKMLLRLGDLAKKHADQAAARDHYRESLSLYQTVGDQQGQIRCLEHLAVLAAPHAPERVAHLLAAATALRAETDAPPHALEREEHERVLSALRTALGNEAFTAAWGAGQGLTLEQAIAEARLLL